MWTGELSPGLGRIKGGVILAHMLGGCSVLNMYEST